jgi:hypothetical protein
LGAGVAAFLGTPSSANLAAAVTNETGSGALVFATSPTLVTPALGTPASGVVTNLTGTASININGTVGATTASTGAFTTLKVNSNNISADNSLGFRNRIINGDMRIDQRNAGASVSITTVGGGQYTLDRWYGQASQDDKFTVQQNAGSVTPPASFTNYLGVTSSSAYSVGSGDYFSLRQAVEGFNTADFAWGTASAIAVTVSFWVRSSLTGTFGATAQGFFNAGSTRTYPFTYTVNAANTWEQKTVTIPGDTSGTWNTSNGVGVSLAFGLGVGSTFAATAGSWQAGNFISVTGAVSVVGTSGATFYITGVQLEAGSVATPFERRPFGTELALCQRYYINAPNGTMVANGLNDYAAAQFPNTMRTAPTITTTATSTFDSSSTYGFVSQFAGLTASGYTATAEL